MPAKRFSPSTTGMWCSPESAISGTSSTIGVSILAVVTLAVMICPTTSGFSECVRPLYLLGADEIEEAELPLVEDPAKAHQLALEIEANLPAIYRYWLPRRKAAVETVRREEPKVGRNDDCPCGSGKKFKKCCGADSAE